MKDKGWAIREESKWSLVCEMNKHFAGWCRLLRCWRRGGAFLWCAKFISSGGVQQAPECTHRAQLRTWAKSQRIDPEYIRLQIPPSSFHYVTSPHFAFVYSVYYVEDIVFYIYFLIESFGLLFETFPTISTWKQMSPKHEQFTHS